MKILSHITLNDSGLIMNPHTGEHFFVNRIKLAILRMLNNNESKPNIKKEILLKFQIESSAFEIEYSELVNLLNENQLIEVLED